MALPGRGEIVGAGRKSYLSYQTRFQRVKTCCEECWSLKSKFYFWLGEKLFPEGYNVRSRLWRVRWIRWFFDRDMSEETARCIYGTIDADKARQIQSRYIGRYEHN